MKRNQLSAGVKAALMMNAIDKVERVIEHGARHTFGAPAVVEEAATFDKAAWDAVALKIPLKDARRECAKALQDQLDAALKDAIERHLGVPLVNEAQVRGRLTLHGDVFTANREQLAVYERGETYAMEGVPILWAGPVKIEHVDDEVRATRHLRHLLGESAP